MRERTAVTSLPVDVAAGVHQIAEQLHQVLRGQMTRAEPTPEAALLWQTAKLLNTAVGALGYTTGDAPNPHTAQWVDAADLASDIADAALGIAAAELTLPEAVRQVEKTAVDLVDLGLSPATASSGTIEVTRNPGDQDALTADVVAVQVAGDPGRALTVTSPDQPEPANHTPSTLLRTAHHLHRLGATLGEVVDAGDPTAPSSGA